MGDLICKFNLIRTQMMGRLLVNTKNEHFDLVSQHSPGDFDTAPPPSPDKRFARGSTMSRDGCIRRLGNSSVRFLHADTMCTTIPSCNNDNGNPLVVGRSNIVVGLHSINRVIHWNCGIPDIHVRVFSHVAWIRSTMQALSN